MRKVFTPEDIEKITEHVSAIAELVHESNLKVAKELNLPEEIIAYMNSKTLSCPEDLECTCPDCNPEA